jgi:DNA-binding FadR family transcriptional regulator
MGADVADVGLTTAALRAVTRFDSQPYGLSAQIAQGLADAIRLGLIPDGERLPPEVQLSEQLRVSTVTLREALSVLRTQGLVITRRGRAGGTFAQAPFDSGALPQRLGSFSTQDLRELGDHRSAISGAAARLAAERALPAEIGRLRRTLDRMRAATLPDAARRADTQFTIEVALAAQSARLTMEELRLRAEIGDLLWIRLTADDLAAVVEARERLVEAIERREPSRARELAERHVASDTRRLLRLRLGLYGPAR